MVDWLNQEDTTKMVRWGALKPDETEADVFLVKKGQSLIGEIISLSMRDYENDDGETMSKPAIVMKLDDGTEVRFTAPSRLHTELGLKDGWKKERVAKDGDIIKIDYLGVFKEAKGTPHLFEVHWKK